MVEQQVSASSVCVCVCESATSCSIPLRFKVLRLSSVESVKLQFRTECVCLETNKVTHHSGAVERRPSW